MRSRARSTLRRQHNLRDLTAWLRTAGSVFWMPGKIYQTHNAYRTSSMYRNMVFMIHCNHDHAHCEIRSLSTPDKVWLMKLCTQCNKFHTLTRHK